MKTKSNIALEGTFNGDVIGGLLLWTGEYLQALLFFKAQDRPPEPKTGIPIRLPGLNNIRGKRGAYGLYHKKE